MVGVHEREQRLGRRNVLKKQQALQLARARSLSARAGARARRQQARARSSSCTELWSFARRAFESACVCAVLNDSRERDAWSSLFRIIRVLRKMIRQGIFLVVASRHITVRGPIGHGMAHCWCSSSSSQRRHAAAAVDDRKMTKPVCILICVTLCVCCIRRSDGVLVCIYAYWFRQTD